jgi:hypothetical protein
LPRGLIMSFLAANPADFSYLSSPAVESANKSLSTRNYGGGLRPSYGGHAGSNRAAIAANFRSQCTDDNFALARVCRYVSRLLLGHSFGAFPAPGGTRSSASHSAPLWVSGPPKTSLRTTAKDAAQTSFGPLPESRPSALGSRAHSLSSAQCDPSNNGQIQETETLSCTKTK